MDWKNDHDEGLVPALRCSYGRLAWWVVRLNRVFEPSRPAEPPRTQIPPRTLTPPRRPLPPRPE